jgi:putative inorganic carbon (HCO3(-)) transporter
LNKLEDSKSMESFYALNIGAIWAHFKKENFSFWMICCYLFFEYVRPQSILPWLDILPWAQLFIILAGLGWLIDSNKQWTKNAANKWMVLFFVVILISSSQAYWPQLSYEHLGDFYTWMIIYFLIINIVTTEKRLFIFLLIFFLASFKLSLFGAKTWAMRGFSFTSWGMMGPPGYFQNSGELAIQMLVFSGLSWYFFDAVKPYLSKWRWWMVGSFSATAAMTVMASSSRGGQLALGALLYLIFLRGKITLKAVILIFLLAGVGYWLVPEEQMQRFETMGEDKTSQQRLLYWENGWDMMKKHPWTGIGFFNYVPYYERNYPEGMLYNSAQLPHNIFVQVGTDVGFVGLFIYLALISQVFVNGRIVRKLEAGASGANSFLSKLSVGLEVGFVGFLVAGQFVSVVYYPFMWVQLALIVCVRNVAEHAFVKRVSPR